MGWLEEISTWLRSKFFKNNSKGVTTMETPEMTCDVEQLNNVFKEHGEEILEKMTNVLSEYTEGCLITAVTIYPQEEPPADSGGASCKRIPGDGIICGT